ncbi:SNF2 family N-terminal domain-containing protein [Ilyonectria robusta]|uniref:SNF2 family N-terminal domain-containing protein n=1 Tax=Ilyonectria robusta TaxID=1079257 RepID=UPI001E8E29EA|nr:SNF2 family N-terminal domain-containing protein [Ilyonectria robusta]KAH8665633.1 SNF2 family N-terminal domain-containing protein [Ilyonectria robusta]
MDWDIVEETSLNNAGMKREFPFVEEDVAMESKRQAVGEGIDVGAGTDMSLMGSHDLNGMTGYSQLLPSGHEASTGIYEPLSGMCSPWGEQYGGAFWNPTPHGMLFPMTDFDAAFGLQNTLVPSWENSEVLLEPFPGMETPETAHIAMDDGELEEIAPSQEAPTEMEELQEVSSEKKEGASDNLSTPVEGVTKMESPSEYDTCFGVVLVQTTLNTSASEPDGPSFVVRASGNVISLYEETDKFVGVFICDGLSSLFGQFSVHTTATFAPEKPNEGHCPKGSKASKAQAQESHIAGRLTRVVIYGLFADKDLIGKHLSEAELYLQHPTLDEYDQSVEYFNPHFLLRPGAKMPRIEELSLQTEDETTPAPTILDEVSKGRIWRVFDSASGGEVIPEVTSSPRLKATLKEHQLAALEMMVERECGVIEAARFPTLWEPSPHAANPRYRNKVTGWFEKNPASLHGGILADEMGLGKTLSTLALICWYLDARDEGKIERANDCSPTLVIVPKSTLIGWETQIQKHIFDGAMKVTRYHGPSRHDRIRELAGYDIVLTTYEVLRQDFAAKDEKDTIYSHRWRRIVLDEAHRIRSRSSQLYHAAIAISKLSQTRWCLTGTPIHNSLDDYAALLSFLQVHSLHEKKFFDRFVATPIKENQPYGIERLQVLVRATSLRRTMALHGARLGLQSRSEMVDFVELSASDAELYRFFQEKSFRMAKGMGKGQGKKAPGAGVNRGDGNILSLVLFLRFICNYGERILPKSALEAWKLRDLDAIDLPMQQLRRSCARCKASLRRTEHVDALPCGHEICSSCLLVTDETDDEEDTLLDGCSACQQISGFGSKPCNSLGRSAKVEALIRNLRSEQEPRADGTVSKSVIFSCWTKMMDHVQRDLEYEGFNLERIDGQATLDQRWRAIRRFKEDSTCTIMLASIGSAGEGIDLISACHVHILEPQWNPMTESQAIGRVHRFGQKQRVTVTRYIVKKSIETYIQWIQVEKLRLICQSIDQDSISQAEVDGMRWNRLQDILSLDM